MSALESFTSNVALPADTANLTVTRANVSVGVFDLPTDSISGEDHWIHGVRVEKPNDSPSVDPGADDASKNGMKLHWTSSAQLETAADSGGAIFLSRDAFETGRRVHGTAT